MNRVALHAVDPSRRLALVRAFETAPPGWDVFLWDGTASFDIRVADAPLSDADIAFDIDDPGSAVSEVARALATTSRRVVVVTGARRGVGVSTLALHLAAAYSSSGATSFVDLDRDSSIRARLGFPDDARDWGQSAGLPYACGFRIFLAPSDGEGDASTVLRAASSHADRVVVDAPTGSWQQSALDVCTSAVLVVPPSHQGIAHARAVLERDPNLRWFCIVNRTGAGGELTARHVARELGQPVAAELPCSPFLRDREDDCRLLNERWSRYFRRTLRLAETIS
jgi:hypothetical protein